MRALLRSLCLLVQLRSGHATRQKAKTRPWNHLTCINLSRLDILSSPPPNKRTSLAQQTIDVCQFCRQKVDRVHIAFWPGATKIGSTRPTCPTELKVRSNEEAHLSRNEAFTIIHNALISSRRSHTKVGLLCRPELRSCEIQENFQVSTTLFGVLSPADPFGEGAASSNAEESSPSWRQTQKNPTARWLNGSAARLELNGHQISIEDFGATAFGECLAKCGTIWN